MLLYLENIKTARRKYMAVSYNKLWKLLIDKNMKKTDLKNQSGISSNVLAKMGRDEYVSMESIDKICRCLKCNINDVMDIVDDTGRINFE